MSVQSKRTDDNMIKHSLAVDLGASGTKVFLACLNGLKLELKEVGRFDSFWYEQQGKTYWDVDRIFDEIRKILSRVERDYDIQSIGFDGWGVDFVPLDENDNKIVDPMRYFSMFKEQEKIKREIEQNREMINQHVPGQFQPFNTVYQLMYQKKINPDAFKKIRKIVSLPSYLAGKFCGTYKYEFTHASTTQLFDFEKNNWSDVLTEKLGFGDIFPEVVTAGTIVGQTPSGVDCILPATHDTASAYASISSNSEDTLIVSAGTWCLNGVITKNRQLDSDFILENNYAVEGCYYGSLRILSNTPGLFFWQRIKDELERENDRPVDYSELLQLSLDCKTYQNYIDVDDEKYLLSDNLLSLLKEDLQTQKNGEVLCAVLNSLARRIEKNRQILENGLKMKIKRVHMIGGGIKNTLLCEKISEYLKMPVFTGPVEGTAFGNALIQYLAGSDLKQVLKAEEIVKNSIHIKEYKNRK